MRICDLKDDQLIGSVVRSVYLENGEAQGVIYKTSIDSLDGATCVWIHWLCPGTNPKIMAGAKFELTNEVLHIGGT